MRFVLLALLLGTVLFAQAPPAAADDPPKSSPEPAAQPQAPKKLTPEERARNAEKLKEALQKVTVNVVTGKTCSIPLLNAMPEDAPAIDKPMILPAPSNPGSFAIRQVSPPAPPCDDVKP